MNQTMVVPGRPSLGDLPLDELFLDEAVRLGEDLLGQARFLPDGSWTWGRGADRNNGKVDDSGPFNGRCGEAMFFAALAKTTGQSRYGEAAERALGTLIQRLGEAEYRRDLVEKVSLGIAGSGGILYALVKVATWLEREDLLHAADHLLEAFDPPTILGDHRYDVVWGGAGAIPGMLQLAEQGRSAALDKAVLWGEHLLADRVADELTGLRAWATAKEVASVGFAHGAAGIASALLQLATATGRRDFYLAAIEAFDFERLMWHEAGQNWCDSRVEPQPYMWGWCHGAPGVGLGRIAALDLLEPEHEEGVVLDLHRAIKASILARIPGIDTLCCGYLGRIDFLLEAGRLLGNTSLVEKARALMRERIERASREGYLFSQGMETPEPHLGLGLWQGPTGLAYFLLRMARPEIFPSLLRLA